MAKTYRMNAFARFGNSMSAGLIRLGVGPGGLHLLRMLRGRTDEGIHLREATAEEAAPVLRSYLRQLKLVVGRTST